jgi:methionine synthase I (cobalamin-dependent)
MTSTAVRAFCGALARRVIAADGAMGTMPLASTAASASA